MKKFHLINPISAIIIIPFYGSISVILYNSFDKSIFSIIIVIIWFLVFFKGLIYNYFFKRIEISEKGVKYISPFNKYELQWQEIRQIGIRDFKSGVSRVPWIYFSAIETTFININNKKISKDFIMLNYRKSVIEEINKYWPNTIYNLSKIKNK